MRPVVDDGPAVRAHADGMALAPDDVTRAGTGAQPAGTAPARATARVESDAPGPPLDAAPTRATAQVGPRPSPRSAHATAAVGTARARVGGRWRLPKRAHQGLLTAHVLASVGWFGVAVAVLFCALVGQSRDDVAFFEVVDATLALSIPLGLASAVTGVALSVTTRWGLARHWWVVLKELGTVAVIATDVLVVAPTMARAVDAGVPAEVPGPVYAHVVVLALATVLSIVKPKARTPLGS